MSMSVTEVLSAYWDDGSLPVDPAYIAARMGVSVMADPNLDGSGHYEPTASKMGGHLLRIIPQKALSGSGSRLPMSLDIMPLPTGLATEIRLKISQ